MEITKNNYGDLEIGEEKSFFKIIYQEKDEMFRNHFDEDVIMADTEEDALNIFMEKYPGKNYEPKSVINTGTESLESSEELYRANQMFEFDRSPVRSYLEWKHRKTLKSNNDKKITNYNITYNSEKL